MRGLHPVLVVVALGACVEASPGLEAAAPPSQSLVLRTTPWVPGQTATWTVDGLDPFEEVVLLRGIDTTFGAGGCPAALGGLCLDVVPPVSVFARARADAGGRAVVSRRLPATLPIGDGAGFQAVARRGPGGADSTKSGPLYGRFQRAMTLSSPDAVPHPDPDCDLVLPATFACGGPNPELRWTDVPAGTVTLAFLQDDVTTGAPHWMLWDVPPSTSGLPPGVSGTGGWLFPLGVREEGLVGPAWYGPCSGGANTYRWRLAALDARVRTPPGATFEARFDALETFAAQHALASVALCVE